MMVFILVSGLLLIAAFLAFAVPLLKKSKLPTLTDRNEVNQAYYNYRLAELEEDEQQGSITERDELVKELQQNLLFDIPKENQQEVKANDKPVSSVVVGIGLVLLVTITLFSYATTGGYGQVKYWQQAEANYEQLKSKYETAQLTEDEMRQLALALRTRIFDYGDMMPELLMLGELGMQLNSYRIANEAFEHAYHLDPNNADVQSMYGYLRLMYAQDDSQARFGLSLLNRALHQNPDNLFVIKTLAFYALESKDNDMMLHYWNMWLEKLPEDSPSRPMVASSLAQMRMTAAEQNAQATGVE